MYTEEEARKKMCFNTFTTFMIPKKLGLTNATEVSPQNFTTPCFASKCMGWRWLDNELGNNGNARKGYCGAAGMP